MNKFLISLLIPIVALLGWVLQLERNISSSKIIRVRVEGYDPRDLLSGHFIRFTISQQGINACSEQDQQSEGCLCFIPESESIFYKPIWGGKCEHKPDYCRTYLRGACDFGRFAPEANRYSISEEIAPVLQRVPQNSSIDLALNENGDPQVLSFYAGDETLESFAYRELSEQKETPTPSPN